MAPFETARRTKMHGERTHGTNVQFIPRTALQISCRIPSALSALKLSPGLEGVAYFRQIYENDVSQSLGGETRDAHRSDLPVLWRRIQKELRGGFGC